MFNSLLGNIKTWIESNPATAGGIFTLGGAIIGSILSAILDFRKNIPMGIKKIFSGNFAFAIGSNNFFNQKIGVSKDEDEKEKVGIPVPSAENILTNQQVEVCAKFEEILGVQMKETYQSANRLLRGGDAKVALAQYYRLYKNFPKKMIIRWPKIEMADEYSALCLLNDDVHRDLKLDKENSLYFSYFEKYDKLVWGLTLELVLEP